MAFDRSLATVYRIYRLALLVASAPVTLAEYFDPKTGADYGVGAWTKLVLAGRMIRNNRRIQTGSTFLEHLVIATRILNVPRDVDGAVVECGCYKGGSTANLSLVASLCDRPLHVFDSFEGMPEVNEVDREHVLVHSERVHTYEQGSWNASLAEARRNIATYGDLSVCTFHVGYFEETMPDFETPVAAAFLDVGLRTSAETCLAHLWPLLQDGCWLFTHEAKHVEMASLFFDREWWHATLDSEPPGLVGAGSGLGLHPGPNGFSSLLGYAVKSPESLGFETVTESGEGDNCVDARLVKSD